MLIYSIFPFLVAVYFLLIGFFVFIKGKKKNLVLPFSLLCLVTFIWQGSWTILFQIQNIKIAVFIAKIGHIGIIFLPVLYYHFVISILNKKDRFLPVLYFICFTFLILLFSTNSFISGVYKYSWGYYPKAGLIHLIYLSLTIFLAFKSFYLLWKKINSESDSLAKQKFWYTLLALIIYFFASLDYLDNYGLNLYPLGIIFISISLSIIALVITKLELLNISVIIKKRASILIITLLVIISFCILTYSTLYFIKNLYLIYLIFLMQTLFWSFTAIPFSNFLITTARRSFVRGWYDTNKLLVTISKAVGNLTKREDIFKTIEQHLYLELELEKSAIIIAEKSKNESLVQYCLRENEIKANKPNNQILSVTINSHKIDLNNPSLEFFKHKFNPCSLNELEPEIAELFLKLGFNKKAIILPFHSPEILEGLVILGERSNQIAFKTSDFDFFNLLINNINALLYRLTPYEIIEKQFNENQKRLYDAEIQLIRSKKIEAIVHATRQCHHEVKTPLAIMKLNTERFLENNRTNPKPEEVQEHSTLVLNEIERALEVVRETLTITDGAAKERNVREVNLNEVIQRALKLVPARGVQIITNFDPNLPLTQGVFEDLEIVFTNLMNNAIEAMAGHGTVNITTSHEANNLVITFSDTGKGIPEEMKAKVWEPYVSGAEGKAGNATAGRGWGLTIVNRIIQEHEGLIKLESELNKGATFIISLPVIS